MKKKSNNEIEEKLSARYSIQRFSRLCSVQFNSLLFSQSSYKGEGTKNIWGPIVS